MEKPIIQLIPVPEGAAHVSVKIDGPNYPLILEFDDEGETHHFWLENGEYDGHSAACKACSPVKEK